MSTFENYVIAYVINYFIFYYYVTLELYYYLVQFTSNFNP